MVCLCIFQTSPVKTKSPARKLNFNVPVDTGSRVPNADAHYAPKVTRHYKRRLSSSFLAERRYTAPPNQAGLQLKSVLGYNGNGRKNMVWKYDTGFNDLFVTMQQHYSLVHTMQYRIGLKGSKRKLKQFPVMKKIQPHFKGQNVRLCFSLVLYWFFHVKGAVSGVKHPHF